MGFGADGSASQRPHHELTFLSMVPTAMGSVDQVLPSKLSRRLCITSQQGISACDQTNKEPCINGGAGIPWDQYFLLGNGQTQRHLV
jgi:hypothetical protein